jgi:DNA-binding NarL/FixJ family response regulator
VIRSGDRISTGTGAARRRLTREEAEAGGLPEPMTPEEWRAMAAASRHDHERLIFLAVQHHSATRLERAQAVKREPPPATPLPYPWKRRSDRVTEEEVRVMVELAHRGHTLPQIAEQLNRSTKSVSTYLRSRDVRPRRKTRTPRPSHG